MKNLITYVCSVVFIGTFNLLSAQDSTTTSSDYLERSPIYDYSELHLNNTDTIPDFESTTQKLKITGTIFKSDGITPANDVLLFIVQPNENGEYEVQKSNEKRYALHRGWIKTDADGRYTFYTFVPGSYPHSKELKHIHPIIKEPNRPEYDLDVLLFDDDPMLTKRCRTRLERKGVDSILKLQKVDEMFVVSRNIVLQDNLETIR